MSVWNRSLLPTQAKFCLTLSFTESGPRGVDIELAQHDSGLVAEPAPAVKATMQDFPIVQVG